MAHKLNLKLCYIQEYQTIKEEVPTWARVILNISKSQGSQANLLEDDDPEKYVT